MKYLVLIGDVVGSRGLADRARFQRQFKATLRTLNSRRRTLGSPFTLTLGDEFQAVYREADPVFADVFSLLADLAPVRLRVAAGIGEIVTPLNPDQAIGMDGPAFHRARAQLESLKARDRYLGIQGAGTGWSLPGATLALLSSQLEGWRPTRLKLFARLLQGEPRAEIARRLAITTRAVNKNIFAADLDEWKRILDEIARLLNTELKSR